VCILYGIIPKYRVLSPSIMYTVYVLKSTLNNKYYIGSTSNISQRIINHNAGFSRWTKHGIPWIMVYSEEYLTRSEALIREKKIKSYKSGNEFKKLIQS